MKSKEIRQKFLTFFEKRGHTIIPSASLVPIDDPSVLFNTAGMQPLVPYLLGGKHPTGAVRLVNSQKCLRTVDIEEIGDNTHLTFFEMLGNWSLGDYFKKDAIKWSFEFLTSSRDGLGLNANRLYVTVFKGDDNAPRDEEAYQTWKDIFEKVGLNPKSRIFFKGAKDNWWSPGDNGPCGGDSEIFYDVTGKLTEGLTIEEFEKADDKQHIVEIWNDVFMEYEKKEGKIVGKLEKKNVDTGSGFERIVAIAQGKDNIFETDLFLPMIQKMEELGSTDNTRAKRVVADHLRAAVFLIGDGVVPSNTDQGYILRRLLRRAVRFADILELKEDSLKEIIDIIIQKYGEAYPNLKEKHEEILHTVSEEVSKFRKTLSVGLKQFEKLVSATWDENGNTQNVGKAWNKIQMLPGKVVFDLYQTYGFPLELTKEIAQEKNIFVDEKGFNKEMKKHQDLSRTASEDKFKGGLANNSEITTALHTATHLMLAGLQKYLGNDVHQRGSNITEERTRFDFTYSEKVSKETLDKVEAYVNEAIQNNCIVSTEIVEKNIAKEKGVEGSFWDKYPDKVTVYTIKSDLGTLYSRELCGGPHVKNTKEIKGIFKIKKEQASSAGVRRIKAVFVENE